MEPRSINCPFCESPNLKKHTMYKTQHHDQRMICQCKDCGNHFSETYGTFLAGIRKPLSIIVSVLKARAEGMGLNAACRVFELAKNTILNWECRFSAIKQTLMLYALLHTCIQLIIEGDEVYTKVRKNVPPDESPGWTAVLMERRSRFLLDLRCGKKDRKLFMNALNILEELVNLTQDIALITDGERRYGNVLFEICSEVIRNGKKGRPPGKLRKGIKIRVKNKGSQAHKKGPKRPRHQVPCPEHPDTVQNIKNKDIHANHCEAFNSSLRRRNPAFRRKTNTYAKSEEGLQRTLDICWVIHNFMRSHFTTKQIPALSLGIIDKALSWKDLFLLPIAVT